MAFKIDCDLRTFVRCDVPSCDAYIVICAFRMDGMWCPLVGATARTDRHRLIMKICVNYLFIVIDILMVKFLHKTHFRSYLYGQRTIY